MIVFETNSGESPVMRKQSLLAVLAILLIASIVLSTTGMSVFAQDGGTGMITGPMDGEAKQLTGAGATFPAVLYSKWFSDYAKLTGVEVNYQSIGSGGGIKSISDMTVDFGATDGPMSDEQLAAAKGGNIFHIPTAMGAVVATYNLPEVTETLKFTPDTLAGIFLGEIIVWNDEKLVADNPQLKDIDKFIVVVHRSDGSGTSNIWTSYLTAVSEKWKDEVGAGNSVKWPVGLGGKGNEGVAGNVKQTPYSLGYVELAYALQNELPAALIMNSSGNFIEPTEASVSMAAQGVELPEDMRVKVVNSANEEAYPIAGFTWLLVYENQTDEAKALALTRMLWWAIHDGQAFSAELHYAPLPQDAIEKAEALIKKIMVNGKVALPAEITQ
jgi:phosphate transport system substrate-binding protein